VCGGVWVWGLGLGSRPQTQNPQPPIPNPQSPIPNKISKINNENFK